MFERHHSQRSVLVRVLSGMSSRDCMGGHRQLTVAMKARAARDRLRRFAALTALRWPVLNKLRKIRRNGFDKLKPPWPIVLGNEKARRRFPARAAVSAMVSICT